MRFEGLIASIIGLTLSVEAGQNPLPAAPATSPQAQQQLNQQVQEKLQQQVVNRLTPQLLNPATASVIGSPSAKYIMVVFIDNNCPACRLFYVNSLTKLMQSHPDLTVFIRQWAILGDSSVQVAKGLLAAHRQGAFAPFHHQISLTSPVTRYDGSQVMAMAQAFATQQAGQNGKKFDISQFTKDLNSGEIQGILNANQMLAQQLDLTGTPTVLLGTPSQLRLMSSNSYESLNDALHLMGASSQTNFKAKT